MKHSINQKVKTVFKYNAVRQRDEQSVKIFFSYLQQMKADLISILKKEYQIHTILNKFQSSLQLELRQLQTFSKIMSELKSEVSRLKSILSQKKKRSEEHTSELQSHSDLVCRLLLEKKKKKKIKKIIN